MQKILGRAKRKFINSGDGFFAPVAEKRSKSEMAAAELALRFQRRAQTVLAENPISDFELGSKVASETIPAIIWCLVEMTTSARQ